MSSLLPCVIQAEQSGIKTHTACCGYPLVITAESALDCRSCLQQRRRKSACCTDPSAGTVAGQDFAWMTAFNGGHQGALESLLNRLETVTARLEGIQVFVAPEMQRSALRHPRMWSAVDSRNKLSDLQGGTGGAGPTASPSPAGSAGSSSTSSTSVADYKSLTAPAITALLEAARPLGADVSLNSQMSICNSRGS